MAATDAAWVGRAVTWSVPGRVNLIGEHVDYNDGPVLPIAVDRSLEVRMTPRDDRLVVATSTDFGSARIPVGARPGDVSGWERYIAGAIWSFDRAAGRRTRGLDITVTGSLPPGAGLSSSAAVECGVICALDDAAGTRLSRRRIAELAIQAEREFVGVPCGPMDQFAVMLAEPDTALLLECRTLSTERLPFDLSAAGLVLLVVDTGVRHRIGDGAYTHRRAECERAAAEIGVSSLGDADLAQVMTVTDGVLRRRAHHVVSEIGRVRDVVELLRAGHPESIGALLTQSHQSLADDFEVSCVELDLVVHRALLGGALGARMTGGGFGGSAIVLCRSADAGRVSAAVRAGFADRGLAEPASWPLAPSGGARRLVG